MLHVEEMACPACGHAVEYRVWGLHSGLGPPLVVCPVCNHTLPTKRKEWAQFARKDQGRFLLVSLLGIILAGWWGSGLASLFFSDPRAPFGSAKFQNDLFSPIGWAFALLVAGVQRYRIHLSQRHATSVPHRPKPFDLRMGVQIKYLMFLIVSTVIIAAIGYLIHSAQQPRSVENAVHIPLEWDLKSIATVVFSYGAAIGLSIGALLKMRRLRQAALWVKTEATILESHLERNPNVTNHFEPRIVYRYVFDGRTFAGETAYASGDFLVSPRARYQRVQRYLPESSVVAYVNPQQPEQSCLDCTDQGGIAAMWLLAAAGGLLATGMIWLH